VYAGNKNMFVSYDGSLYVSEVQPTDGPKNYFCVVTLIGTDTAALAKANPIGRSNRGILLLIDDSSKYTSDIKVKPRQSLQASWIGNETNVFLVY